MAKGVVSALRLYLSFLFYVFAIMAVFRLVFWCYAAGDMVSPLGHDAFKAFYIGLRFDARIAALFTLPVGLALCVPRLAGALRRKAGLLAALYTPFFFLLMVVYAVDIGFYSYLGSRIDSLLFDLLEDFQVAVEMTIQSYPVVLIIIGELAATALAVYGFRYLLRREVRPCSGRPAYWGGFAAGFVVFAFCVYGQLNASLFPLRWSYAHFTTEDPIIALGLNPVQSLYDTRMASLNGFDRQQARESYDNISSFLRVDAPNRQTLSFERSFTARRQGRPLNVVIVIMESLSYSKTSFSPGPDDPTPMLKSLGKESLVFSNFFANARTTARAIFTTITGIPDVNRGSTASRNPTVVDQRVIANEFKDYDKYYMIGGNTAWANIRAVLARNIEGLDIHEENDWESPKVDVWGVSDYDLLREAHDLFATRQSDKPFFAIIQTASYHRPYTVPATPGFEHERLSAEAARVYGFESEKDYNSMRYADFSIGEFMRWAKKSDYYQDTVFFIFGDHGLNESGENVRGGYKAGHLWPWHVPLIIHAAPELKLFEPGESSMPCGQVDIMPTAASMAGIAYHNYTLGRDIFDQRYADSRAVYIGDKKDAPMRLVWDGYCYFDNMLGRQGLYRLDDAEATDYAAKEPERLGRYRRLARDIDATARYMLFNNRKRAGEAPAQGENM